MVLLAIFALNLLAIRYTAVMLLVAALVLLLLEAKFGGHGALAVAGIGCLTFGMLTLVAAPVPELGVNPLVAIGSAWIWRDYRLLVRLAWRARRMKSRLVRTRWWVVWPRHWSRSRPKAECWSRGKSGAPWPRCRCLPALTACRRP